MTIVFLILTLSILLLLLLVIKIIYNESSSDKPQKLNIPKLIKNSYTDISSYSDEQLIEISYAEINAHQIGQAKMCLDKGYGYSCHEWNCKCIVDTKEACDIYITNMLAKLNDPLMSEEDKESINKKMIYWDSDVNKCIDTIKATNSDICTTIQNLDKKRDPDYIFNFVPAKLKNCNDNRCEIDKNPTCVIPDGYCESRGLDHDYPNDPNDSGDCYVNDAQYWAEQFLSEDFVRCTRTGDLDCVVKSVNISMALQDAFCSKALGMEGGCGFPQMIPSAKEMWAMVQNPLLIGKFYLNYVVGSMETSVKVIENILNKLGIPVGTTLSDAFSSAKDFVSDVASEISDIFLDIGNSFKDGGEYVINSTIDGAVYIYDNAISPVVDAFEEVGDLLEDAC